MRIVLILLLLFCANRLLSQPPPWEMYYVQFSDKNNNPYSAGNPLQFLSQRSIDRRSRENIEITEEDLPVNPSYVDSLEKICDKIVFTTKWLNGATVQIHDMAQIALIDSLPFVKSISEVHIKTPGDGYYALEKSNMLAAVSGPSVGDYGQSYTQMAVEKGNVLHDLGYYGAGKLISVHDAGFQNVNTLTTFDSLRNNNGIVAVHDFILNNDSVYVQGEHGMWVMSLMTGQLPGQLIGVAPKANFLLLRSENEYSESLVELYAWVSAAEFADSAGADIITSSLGYTTFDDAFMNYTYLDMNGVTTPISKAAEIASSKGMVVVSAAGNSGQQAWHYISAPADANNILAVGSCNYNSTMSAFSSYGPTADGRIKPDVDAVGNNNVIASLVDGQVTSGAGTSFATPIIAGLTACLWEAFPDKTNMQIMDAVRRSASKYTNPDDSCGYGIADFDLAYQYLKHSTIPSSDYIAEAYPNPTSNNLTISFFSNSDQEADLALIDMLGRQYLQHVYIANANDFNTFTVGNLSPLPNGVYILVIKTANNVLTQKIVKQGE